MVEVGQYGRKDLQADLTGDLVSLSTIHKK